MFDADYGQAAKAPYADELAEGVETHEELSILRDLGCHRVQGFIFSHARPVDEFLAGTEAFNEGAGTEIFNQGMGQRHE